VKISKKVAMVVFCFTICAAVFAQEDGENTVENAPVFAQEDEGNAAKSEEKTAKVELKLDIPVFDVPYQTDANMNQSLKLTTGVYSSMHYGLKKMYDGLNFTPFWNDAIYYSATAAGILAFAYVLPFGYPWTAHEYTHSILSRNGIHGINNDYRFIDRGGITGIYDDELANFKRKAPYDFIRMNSASNEAYNLFSDALIRNYFYYEPDDLSWVSALIATWISRSETGSAAFINYDLKSEPIAATLADVEAILEEWYKNDGVQENRSLAGFEMLNWGYELFHPNEPYAARGLHPSGDGSVARYIRFNQFSDDEMNYLVKHSYLSLLNYVSPLLLGFSSFPLGNSGLRGNFALRHYLTSFGTDISASVFLKKKPFNMAFTYHSYQNYNNYFPAIEADLVDYPFNIGNLEMFLSPRVLIGMQPKDQVFKTDSPEFLGLFGLRVDFKVHKNIFLYFDFTVKTDGWVAGNEYLDANASVKLGVSLRF
jgi:hypothetical protein